MYQVLVADDEPLALRNICSIIEKRCKDYEIAGTAENGRDALLQIREKDIDLVISDIRMPSPNGIELASLVREEDPDICFIIVSGYTDFEYTQGAIRSGVIDYLLKPITPAVLTKSLAGASDKIERIRYMHRNEIMRELCSRNQVNPKELIRFFPAEEYYLVLIRQGALPRRFTEGRNDEIFSDISEQYMVFGRDEMETLYLIPEMLVRDGGIEQLIGALQEKHSPEESFMTVIYYSSPAKREMLQDRILEMYEMLVQKLRIGHSRRIDIEKSIPHSADIQRNAQDMILKKIAEAAAANDAAMIRSEILRLFAMGEEAEKSQLWMEGAAREIAHILRRENFYKKTIDEIETTIGDAFFNATNVEQLTDSLCDILLLEETKIIQKADPEEFFDSIETYLRAHLEKPLSLQELCHEFGVSQTYMSKLFRKHTSLSYNQYLTYLRIGRARELMEENPGCFVKDIAAMVGYEDQFYFSRIFRTYTGMSPTDYLKGIEEGKS